MSTGGLYYIHMYILLSFFPFQIYIYISGNYHLEVFNCLGQSPNYLTYSANQPSKAFLVILNQN